MTALRLPFDEINRLAQGNTFAAIAMANAVAELGPITGGAWLRDEASHLTGQELQHAYAQAEQSIPVFTTLVWHEATKRRNARRAS